MKWPRRTSRLRKKNTAGERHGITPPKLKEVNKPRPESARGELGGYYDRGTREGRAPPRVARGAADLSGGGKGDRALGNNVREKPGK